MYIPTKSKGYETTETIPLVLSAMLIVCTTGCYDKDEIKDAEKYLFQKISILF